jgi:hypothetical protein
MRAVLTAIAILVAAPTWAATLHFTAKLNGGQETPPNASKGAGLADVNLDTTRKTFTWKVTYSGLSGPATATHFHGPAPAGKAAPVAVPMVPPLASPIAGSAPITDAQIGDLEAGMWYVNVHTAKHPDGEIRGQLTKAH